MRVIVVGCGRVGSELALSLQQEGHEVSVIDKNARAFRRFLPEGWGGKEVVGYGFDRAHLEIAGIQTTEAVAAVTSGDNSNILTARIARENYGVPSVVARIYDPRRALIYQRLGIPTVATVTWTTEQVRRRLIPNTTSTEWSDPTGDVSIVERSLPDSLAGKSLAPLMSADDYRLVMITRAGKARLASPDLVGQEGDRLVLAVNTAAIDQLSSPEWMAAAPAGQH